MLKVSPAARSEIRLCWRAPERQNRAENLNVDLMSQKAICKGRCGCWPALGRATGHSGWLMVRLLKHRRGGFNLTREMFIREPCAVSGLQHSPRLVLSLRVLSMRCLYGVLLDQLLLSPFLRGKAALKVVRAWDADGQTDHSQGRAAGTQLPS